MLSRRNFLGYSIAGMFTAAAGCRPKDFDQLVQSDNTPTRGLEFLTSKKDLKERKKYFLGYPLNMSTPPPEFFQWRTHLKEVGLGDFGYNNVGNPYAKSSIPYNTHDLEREIINRFGKQYGFSPDDTWGFLSHSGTDSNMHGMYIGRTILKGETGVVPKCYFTREAHYSIQILCDLLGMEAIYVNTLADASMDIEDLRKRIDNNPDHPALIVASVGTTFKGAIDDVDRINDLMVNLSSYLHLDAALFGGYLPHTLGAKEVMQRLDGNNARNRYDSIAISCHKFFGFPSPAGLFITTGTVYDEFHQFYSKVHNPEYIGHVPGTITCSRDAVKPAEFYFFSNPESIQNQARDAREILKNTDYLYAEMQNHLPALNARRENNLSNTIYFRKPSEDIIEKYSLATMHLDIDGQLQDFAHAVVMPHIKKKVLDEFLSDLDEDRSLKLG
jgi:glutamate/tyrosine decarboxylase-like PLP-dependent enzyme